VTGFGFCAAADVAMASEVKQFPARTSEQRIASFGPQPRNCSRRSRIMRLPAGVSGSHSSSESASNGEGRKMSRRRFCYLPSGLAKLFVGTRRGSRFLPSTVTKT
jgi:hypothetical protein